MNRSTQALKRLVCCVKGHKPFPERDVLPTPEEPIKWQTIGSLTGSHIAAGSGLGLSANGTWQNAGNTFYDNGVNFTCGPVQVTAKICSRCLGVYWNSRIKGQWFLSAKALPELRDYMNWQDRQAWELRQRSQNPMADQLYRQYQVMLKLAHNPGENNEQT
jgi:hypothetical protein